MNNIKNLFTLCIVLFFLSNGYSQFGVRAGMNLATISISGEGSEEFKDFIKTKTGFHFGLAYQIPFNYTISLEPGILLSTKGYKVDIMEGDYSETVKSNSYYLEIPLLLRAKFNIGGPILFLQGGPYIGIGIGGSIHDHYEEAGDVFDKTQNIKWGTSDNDDQEQFDIGLNVGGGVEFNSFQFAITYSFGISDIIPNSGNAHAYNRVLGFSFGYNFISNGE